MVETPRYIVKPLGKENRAAFYCGDKELDSYFHERASRDVREKLSAVFILVTEAEPDVVIGYYSLSPQEIDAGEFPEELKKRTGRYKRIGATLLGRLAVSKEHHGKKLGAFLLVDALRRSLEASKMVMSYAVVVDAKGEHVIAFYKKFGFLPLRGNRLFLPMKTIERNFQA
ncbi:MAG TPA: GNAT family N-acetyltransferase [Terriglobales bacterium]|nr:GNAT family N-acetyltransferase [Terriglobales bacterium]